MIKLILFKYVPLVGATVGVLDGNNVGFVGLAVGLAVVKESYVWLASML